MTWTEIVRSVPALRDVEAQALALLVEPPVGYCKPAEWYGFEVAAGPGLKREMTAVLFAAVPADLIRPGVYEVAYQHLFDLLPGCVGPCPCTLHDRSL